MHSLDGAFNALIPSTRCLSSPSLVPCAEEPSNHSQVAFIHFPTELSLAQHRVTSELTKCKAQQVHIIHSTISTDMGCTCVASLSNSFSTLSAHALHQLFTLFLLFFHFLRITVGWFLFSKISEIPFVHVPKLFPLLHWFQNTFCFLCSSTPSHGDRFFRIQWEFQWENDQNK